MSGTNLKPAPIWHCKQLCDISHTSFQVYLTCHQEMCPLTALPVALLNVKLLLFPGNSHTLFEHFISASHICLRKGTNTFFHCPFPVNWTGLCCYQLSTCHSKLPNPSTGHSVVVKQAFITFTLFRCPCLLSFNCALLFITTQGNFHICFLTAARLRKIFY